MCIQSDYLHKSMAPLSPIMNPPGFLFRYPSIRPRYSYNTSLISSSHLSIFPNTSIPASHPYNKAATTTATTPPSSPAPPTLAAAPGNVEIDGVGLPITPVPVALVVLEATLVKFAHVSRVLLKVWITMLLSA